MFRSAVSIIVGLLLGITAVHLLEAVGHLLYPPPEGLDATDREAFRAAAANFPPGAFVFLLVGWALGSFVGGATAAHLAYRRRILHALIVGALLMAGGIVSLVAIPHPAWVTVTGLLLFLPCAWLGGLAGTQPLPGSWEGWIAHEVPDYSQTR